MDTFPDGVWCEILSYLSVQDVVNFSYTCTKFWKLINNYRLLERVASMELPKIILEWFQKTKIQDYKLIYMYFKRSYNKFGHLQIHTIHIEVKDLNLYNNRLTILPDSICPIDTITNLIYL